MNQPRKAKGPGAAATAHRAEVVRFPQGTQTGYPERIALANPSFQELDFPLGVIWELEYRGEMIRLSVSEMSGSRFADVRRFYRQGIEWLPSKKGCTLPLSALVSFHKELGCYLAANDSTGAQDAA